MASYGRGRHPRSLTFIVFPADPAEPLCAAVGRLSRLKTKIIPLPKVRAVVKLSGRWGSGCPWLPLGEPKQRGQNGRPPCGLVSEHPFGHSFVCLIGLLWKFPWGIWMNVYKLLMSAHFDVSCAQSRQILQYFSWSISVVDVNSVNDWMNTALNHSELASSCCGLRNMSLIHSTGLSKLDADSTSMMCAIILCVRLSGLFLTALIPPLPCLTLYWKKTVHAVQVFEAIYPYS